jgi:hypothetical protein
LRRIVLQAIEFVIQMAGQASASSAKAGLLIAARLPITAEQTTEYTTECRSMEVSFMKEAHSSPAGKKLLIRLFI